jgi:hypothetical protein
MSTPVRGADGPLGYAPRWARTGSGRADIALESGARSAPAVDLPQDLRPARLVMPLPPRETVASREVAPDREFVPRRDLLSTPHIAPQEPTVEVGDEPLEPAPHWDAEPSPGSRSRSFWKRKKRSTAFEGDTALKELRSHLASAPDHTPEPPLYRAKTPIFAAAVRLMGVMVLAAVGALGFLWITAPHGGSPQVASKLGGNDVALASYPAVSYRGLEAPQNSARAPGDVAAVRTPDAPPSAPPWAMANYPRDPADGIGAPPAVPRAAVAPRAPSRVAAPPVAAQPAPAATPPAPLPAEPALSAAAPPPAAPAPAAKVPVITAPVLVTPPATPPDASRDRDEIAALLVRARTYLSDGDVAAARLVLRRAAERDDPQAALALGGTYDPVVLKRLGIINFHADPAQAREWYRRAVELGSPDAALRLEQLVQTDH